jgi:hypothetical protein
MKMMVKERLKQISGFLKLEKGSIPFTQANSLANANLCSSQKTQKLSKFERLVYLKHMIIETNGVQQQEELKYLAQQLQLTTILTNITLLLLDD